MISISHVALHLALVALARLTRGSLSTDAVRIESRDTALVLHAANGNARMRFVLPAEVTSWLTATVPAALLAKLSKPESRRKAGQAIFDAPDDVSITLTADGITTRIATEPSVNVPRLDDDLSAPTQWVGLWPAEQLRDALAFVVPAISDDESRPQLCVAALNGQRLAGTDGHRLHVAQLDTPAAERVLIPRAAAQHLLKLLPGADHVGMTLRDGDTLRAGHGIERGNQD